MVVLRNGTCVAVRFEDYAMEAKLTVEYRLARFREMKSKAHVSSLCEAGLAQAMKSGVVDVGKR